MQVFSFHLARVSPATALRLLVGSDPRLTGRGSVTGGERIERSAIEEPIVWSWLVQRRAQHVSVGRHSRLWNAFDWQYRLVRLDEAGDGGSCASFAGVRGLEWMGGFWCPGRGAPLDAARIQAFLDALGPPS